MNNSILFEHPNSRGDLMELKYLYSVFNNASAYQINRLSGKIFKSKFLSFDYSIHAVIWQFNKLADKKSKTVDKIHCLLNENWISDGYESEEEERKFYVRGLIMLANYVKNPQDKNTENLILNRTICKKVHDKYLLCAKFDKVYKESEDKINIIDYKTGKVICYVDNFIIDFRTATYILLAYELFHIYPKTINYYYLNYNKMFSRTINEDDILEAFSCIQNNYHSRFKGRNLT